MSVIGELEELLILQDRRIGSKLSQLKGERCLTLRVRNQVLELLKAQNQEADQDWRVNILRYAFACTCMARQDIPVVAEILVTLMNQKLPEPTRKYPSFDHFLTWLSIVDKKLCKSFICAAADATGVLDDCGGKPGQ